MDIERRQANVLLSVWVDHCDGDRPLWRGALVTAADQRLYFSTLAELNRWLCEMTGWEDPAPNTAAGEERLTS